MVAAYIREKFPNPAAEAALAMADVGEKGVEYTVGARTEVMWWLWQILRSVVIGVGKKSSHRVTRADDVKT